MPLALLVHAQVKAGCNLHTEFIPSYSERDASRSKRSKANPCVRPRKRTLCQKNNLAKRLSKRRE